jgi:hypothetical protein
VHSTQWRSRRRYYSTQCTDIPTTPRKQVTALTAAMRSGDAAVGGEACEVLCIWAAFPYPAWDRLLDRDERLLVALLQDVSKLMHLPV